MVPWIGLQCMIATFPGHTHLLIDANFPSMKNTVNSEIFAEASHVRSFAIIKPSRMDDITLSFTDIGKSCPVRDFFVANVSFSAIRENKILAKISEFTVF